VLRTSTRTSFECCFFSCWIPERKKNDVLNEFNAFLTSFDAFKRLENELKRNESRFKTSLNGIEKLEIILFVIFYLDLISLNASK
jgi:hypothetical protein